MKYDETYKEKKQTWITKTTKFKKASKQLACLLQQQQQNLSIEKNINKVSIPLNF